MKMKTETPYWVEVPGSNPTFKLIYLPTRHSNLQYFYFYFRWKVNYFNISLFSIDTFCLDVKEISSVIMKSFFFLFDKQLFLSLLLTRFSLVIWRFRQQKVIFLWYIFLLTNNTFLLIIAHYKFNIFTMNNENPN